MLQLVSGSLSTHLLIILDEFNRNFSDVCESLELRLAEALVHLHEPHKIVRHFRRRASP